MSKHQVWLCDDRGKQLQLLEDLRQFSYVHTVNGVGAFTLVSGATISQDFLRRDRQIQIWRKPIGGILKLDFLGFLNRWKYTESAGNLSSIVLSGVDSNELLKRRIVAEKAESTYAGDTAEIDDMMKGIVTRSLGSGAAAGRILTADGFFVDVDKTAGAELTKRFAWRNVLELLQDLSQTSRTSSPEVFFGVYVDKIGTGFPGTIELKFKTFINQPGIDRTVIVVGSAKPFSVELGTLSEPHLEYDYSGEINYLYVGGPGQADARRLVETSDDDSIGQSWLGRREGFYNASGAEDTDAAVLDEALGELQANRGIIRFGGIVLNTPESQYGIHWGLGDKVPIFIFGRELSGIIRQIKVSVDSNDNETVTAVIEGEYSLV